MSKRENRHWFVSVSWIPLVIGIIGYNCIGKLSFWESVYASAALYFINPVSDINNVIVIVAKFSALCISASVIFSTLYKISKILKKQIVRLYPDTVVIYTDIEEKGEQLSGSVKHSIVSNDKSGEAKNASCHFIAFQNDLDNLHFYFRNQLQFQNSDVYLQLDAIEPSLLKSYETTKIRFFNNNELIAQDYWKKNPVFTVGKTQNYIYKIAIVGFNSIGKAVFKKGYLNNLYDLDQSIEYHIWGVPDVEKEFLENLPCENKDVIIVHKKTEEPCCSDLLTMNRVILIEIDTSLLQQLIFKTDGTEIHYYSDGKLELDRFVDAENIRAFGDNEYLTVDNIRSESLFRMAKLLNYDYFLLTHKTQIEEIDEQKMDSEWDTLSGFHKESSLARANHFEIEYVLRNAGTEIEKIKHIEHIRWSRFYYYNHWKYGAKKDSRRRTHPDLCPYEELVKNENKKDDIYSDRVRDELIAEMNRTRNS